MLTLSALVSGAAAMSGLPGWPPVVLVVLLLTALLQPASANEASRKILVDMRTPLYCETES